MNFTLPKIATNKNKIAVHLTYHGTRKGLFHNTFPFPDSKKIPHHGCGVFHFFLNVLDLQIFHGRPSHIFRLSDISYSLGYVLLAVSQLSKHHFTLLPRDDEITGISR